MVLIIYKAKALKIADNDAIFKNKSVGKAAIFMG
jgi:hypothetical protein